jgi:transketolase
VETDDELKERLKNLGWAISSAMSDSTRIAEAIARIKESGYDLFLVLEATIGLSRNKEADTPATLGESLGQKESGEFKLNITASDKEFLQALRIKVDEVSAHEISGPVGE